MPETGEKRRGHGDYNVLIVAVLFNVLPYLDVVCLRIDILRNAVCLPGFSSLLMIALPYHHVQFICDTVLLVAWTCDSPVDRAFREAIFLSRRVMPLSWFDLLVACPYHSTAD